MLGEKLSEESLGLTFMKKETTKKSTNLDTSSKWHLKQTLAGCLMSERRQPESRASVYCSSQSPLAGNGRSLLKGKSILRHWFGITLKTDQRHHPKFASSSQHFFHVFFFCSQAAEHLPRRCSSNAPGTSPTVSGSACRRKQPPQVVDSPLRASAPPLVFDYRQSGGKKREKRNIGRGKIMGPA